MTMLITPTHINYYHVCHRKLWLFSHGIQMEHTSDLVSEGKLIHETSYPQRPEKYTEVKLDEAVIDFYDAKNREIHEVKKSDKIEKAHIAQVKYYIYLLKKIGIDGVKGIIEYPKLRNTESVELSTGDEADIENWKRQIKDIYSGDCPGTIGRSLCKSCSYLELCYS
jgi:CRISPR-associated exonuclease Cas4